ncbi:hypothetical protein CDL15_Pgr016464 [Punica granatum]|uniref:Uncharacterized protein n=1 Tax=Punica granatum TaxID=22663 RepID=A0A218XSH9_PUNGR|nr:hypothetical protein CDL15_Pgr016464 [Punica granatum]
MGRADGTRVLRNLAKGRYFRSSQGFHGSTSCERPGLEEMVEIEMRLNRAWSELIKGKSKKVADSPWMKMFMSNIRLVCVPPRNRWPELASVHDVNSRRHCGDAKKSSFNGGEEEEEVKKKRVTMEEGCGVVHLSRSCNPKFLPRNPSSFGSASRVQALHGSTSVSRRILHRSTVQASMIRFAVLIDPATSNPRDRYPVNVDSSPLSDLRASDEATYMSTLARDVPFAGLMVMFYEALKDITSYGKQKWAPNSNYSISSSFEGLLLGGLAGGKFCKLDSVTSNGLSLHDLQI